MKKKLKTDPLKTANPSHKKKKKSHQLSHVLGANQWQKAEMTSIHFLLCISFAYKASLPNLKKKLINKKINNNKKKIIIIIIK